jgi:hypothetical protein
MSPTPNAAADNGCQRCGSPTGTHTWSCAVLADLAAIDDSLDEVRANIDHGDAPYNPWGLKALRAAETLRELLDAARVLTFGAEGDRRGAVTAAADDEGRWLVRWPGYGVLNRTGDWEPEVLPADRDGQFADRCLFAKPDAIRLARAAAAIPLPKRFQHRVTVAGLAAQAIPPTEPLLLLDDRQSALAEDLRIIRKYNDDEGDRRGW